MKFLHTSDWHVGKTLKGQTRLPEQRDVLAEIVQAARTHDVDAVIVAGDLYETFAPSADAVKLVNDTLLALSEDGRRVIAMAGNHDHAGTLEAWRTVAGRAGITLLGLPRRADDGGLVQFTTRAGELVQVACLPFLSQRYAVSAAALVAGTPADATGAYDQRIRDITAHLTAGFTQDAVTIIAAHLTVTGGSFGGGERLSQSIFDYHVPASIFGPSPHYVALGHLHRRQRLPAPCPVHYSGSPLMVDFGEQANSPVIVLVDAHPGAPAEPVDIPIASGRRLTTLTGTLDQVIAAAADVGDDWLRIVLTESARANLREDVTTAIPNVLEVTIHPDYRAATTSSRPAPAPNATPAQLLAQYLTEKAVDDPRLIEMFTDVHDRVASRDSGGGQS